VITIARFNGVIFVVGSASATSATPHMSTQILRKMGM